MYGDSSGREGRLGVAAHGRPAVDLAGVALFICLRRKDLLRPVTRVKKKKKIIYAVNFVAPTAIN